METAPKKQRWPARLWLVRHGESAGNVAQNEARAAGELRVDIDMRDVASGRSRAGSTAPGRGGRLGLVRYNFVAPLEREGAPVTGAKDQSVGPR